MVADQRRFEEFNMNQSTCRLCRREKTKLFLKGERCLSPKCSVLKRPYPPGQTSQIKRGKVSDYGNQLRAKQKVKSIYRISESQFKNYYLKAVKTKGKTGETILQLLERRLDNVVYKLGLARSLAEAHQLVSHKKIKVNNKINNISSFHVKIKDVIELSDKNNKNQPKSGQSKAGKTDVPVWLKFDPKNLKGEVIKMPERSEMPLDIDEQLIVEFYSR